MKHGQTPVRIILTPESKAQLWAIREHRRDTEHHHRYPANTIKDMIQEEYNRTQAKAATERTTVDGQPVLRFSESV